MLFAQSDDLPASLIEIRKYQIEFYHLLIILIHLLFRSCSCLWYSMMFHHCSKKYYFFILNLFFNRQGFQDYSHFGIFLLFHSQFLRNLKLVFLYFHLIWFICKNPRVKNLKPSKNIVITNFCSLIMKYLDYLTFIVYSQKKNYYCYFKY